MNFTIKDQIVTGTYTSQGDEDGVPGYDVMLPEPISLFPEEDTTIIATIKGPNSYYGQKGKSSVKVNSIAVTFKDAPGLSGNCASITKGQFHDFFLYCRHLLIISYGRLCIVCIKKCLVESYYIAY